MMEIKLDKNIIECNKNGILIIFVNGRKVVDPSPDPEHTLLTYLRDKLRLCGTKLGCGEGGCGACTVMISKIDRRNNNVKHLAVNACLTPVCAIHGMAVTTIEGIGSTKTRLHPVQERIAKAHGSQCGFCTPGIVMSMYALLRNLPKPSMKDMEIAFQGNLCRCTGYRPIIEGYRTFTKEYECAMGDKCCKKNGNGNICETSDTSDELFIRSEFTPIDHTQEPIFPAELKISDSFDRDLITFKSSRVTWLRPTRLKQLLLIKKKNPDVKIVMGNTEVGVEVKFKHCHYPMLVYPGLIHELTEITDDENGLRIGSAVTLMEIEEIMRNQMQKLPEHETRLFKAIVDMLQYFAGKQIRNVASVGGNIMTGSPISDLNPIFMAAGIELEVNSLENGPRKIKFDENFFIGYRKTILKSDELLVSIYIPRSKKNEYFLAYKQAKRRDDDIAIVNGAFNVKFKLNSDIIDEIRLSYGGMAPKTVLAVKTAKKVKGMKWTNEMLEVINSELINELPLSSGAPGGMILYRRSLTLSLFFKCFLEISQRLEEMVKGRVPISDKERSGAELFHTLTPKSAQLFEKTPDNQPSIDPIGRPKVHLSAFKQVTGEAVYCDDMPHFENELYLAFVLSTKAHAKINSIDASEALKQSGVHAFFSSKDLSEKCNKAGPVLHDEEFFITDTVTSQGQIIGAIVADTQALAQRASRMVKIDYTELTPIIVTIEDAIIKKSYFPGFPKQMLKGNVEEAFSEADHIIEGECRLGGQEHFYLETQAFIAVPRDQDELEIFCSTQHPTEIQKLTARALELPASKIVARVKRMGGGFGGKESRGAVVAIPVALAAYRLGRPVRCMLDRDEDMMITGTRHPFLCRYKVACMKDGKIIGCDIEIYNNGGYSLDLSSSILVRAMFNFENAYFIPNVRVTGWCCKTNLTSNTAFRGFGGPQGMFAGEHIIRDVANCVGIDYVDVAELNMYKIGQITHYNQEIPESNLRRCWNEVIENSNYRNRKIEVDKFNEKHRWRKRGISLVPTKFGIAYSSVNSNQAGALVLVYIDGSVLISHGGTEMGQGLHTKMIQVASRALNLPTERFHISETSTDKVPNTSATAASASSDLNGMAVLNACNQILERLLPYQEKYPEIGWNGWINKAYFDRVSLSAAGFYKTPDIGYNPTTNTGQAFNYFSNGAACSEVEIDCLTGDHQVIRTDIVMDLGSSLNPAIDIGQIEGGFMQGYGLFTLEELIYSPTGTLYSRGPGMYKIPGFADIPGEFNVALLTGAPNPRAIYSSKGIGEPPLFLASSVFFAIKEAIKSARKDANIEHDFKLPSPATSSRIRMACADEFTNRFEEHKDDSISWNIVP